MRSSSFAWGAVFVVVGAVACAPGAEGTGTSTTGAGNGSQGGSGEGASGSGGDGAASTTSSNSSSSSSSTGGGCVDADCPPNQICAEDGTCVDGCNVDKPCDSALTCCDGACVDAENDVAFCGGCAGACDLPPAIATTCVEGFCTYGACDTGFFDCDGLAETGCESSVVCTCTPGDTQPCYEGPANTEGVGACTAGLRTCNDAGDGWSGCQGDVLPSDETCGNDIDDDCDGATDSLDADGDGYDMCVDDCCDNPNMGCGNPELVNPGAFEVDGNSVDDDCDTTVDNPLPTCDGSLTSNSSTALDYARAIDLCATTTENGNTWGVISATLQRPHGGGTINSNSRSIRPSFGSQNANEGVRPLGGSRLVVLSTGHAAAQASPNNVSPSYAAFQGGEDMSGTDGGVPADWLAANGGVFPNAPGCPEPGTQDAIDGTMLKVRVRAPSNANSFSVSTYFYSSEFPEWVCTAFNDFFVVLLDSNFSGMPANPLDKNLAVYTAPNMATYPVGVNLASGNTGLFRQCVNGPTGCGFGTATGSTSACLAVNELLGTGFHIVNPPALDPAYEPYCGASNRAGGGTGWLTTSGNVVPGEVIELRFALWDTSDPWYDSLVLLDNFRWNVSASTPGTEG